MSIIKSIIKIEPPSILIFSFDSGCVRPSATLEIQHVAPLTASSSSLAAFKLKLNNVRRFTVSKKCGWILRGETIKVRIEFIAPVGEKPQNSTDLFSVETLCINDADEMAAFVSAKVGNASFPSGSSPSAIADKVDPALLWTFFSSDRRKQTTLTAKLPTEVSTSPAKSSPTRGLDEAIGNGSPPSRSLGSSFRNLTGSNTIPHGQGLGWRKGPLIGRGAFGMVHIGVITCVNSSSTVGVNRGTLIALKEIPLATPQSWSAAFREATALTACSGHPNIPRLFALRRLPPSQEQPLERALLIMELVSGGTLSQFATAWANKNRSPMARGVGGATVEGSALRSNETGGQKEREDARGLPENIVCAYIRELLNALEHVHARGLAHRDVKGANLLLSSAGRVMLADFGSCKLSWDPENSVTNSNAPPMSSPLATGSETARKGAILGGVGDGQGALKSAREQGTLQWMAPEVVTVGLKLGVFHSTNSPGSQNISSTSSPNGGTGATGSPTSSSPIEVDSLSWWQRADVWSVGCTAIELLTARPPWFGIANDSAEVMLHMTSTDLRDTIPSWLSDEAKFFIRACLHPNALARPTPTKLLSLPFVSLSSNLGKSQEGENIDDEFIEHRLNTAVDVQEPTRSSFMDSDPDDVIPLSQQRQSVFEGNEIVSGSILEVSSFMASAASASDPVNQPPTLECSSVPMDSLQRASKSLARLIPLVMLACRKTHDWATRRAHRPSGASADFLSRCVCSLRAEGVSSLHVLAEEYTAYLNDNDAALAVAQEISELEKRSPSNCIKIPHALCSDGILFGNWDALEQSGVRSSSEAAFLSVVSRARYFVSDLVSANLEILMINLLYQRVSSWVSIPLRSNPGDEISGLFPQPDRKQKNESVLLRNGSLAGVAILTAWHTAAASRIAARQSRSDYNKRNDNLENDGKLDDDDWFIQSPEGASNIGDDWDDMNEDFDYSSDDLFIDPAHASVIFAKMHVWALEISTCLTSVLAFREVRARESRYPARLSCTFSWIERRVYARWLWFKRSWYYCSIAAKIESKESESVSGKEDDEDEEDDE